MDREQSDSTAKPETSTSPALTLGARGWSAPSFEVISLSCEITAYAPDDEPLF